VIRQSALPLSHFARELVGDDLGRIGMCVSFVGLCGASDGGIAFTIV
jgi:hypothetical protein